MEINYEALGARIRKIRKQKHMTQEYVAEKTEISVPHMSNIENASKKLSLKLLVSIADILEVTVDELLMDSYPVEKRQDIFYKEMEVMLERCDAGERQVVVNTVASLVESLIERRKSQD